MQLSSIETRRMSHFFCKFVNNRGFYTGSTKRMRLFGLTQENRQPQCNPYFLYLLLQKEDPKIQGFLLHLILFRIRLSLCLWYAPCRSFSDVMSESARTTSWQASVYSAAIARMLSFLLYASFIKSACAMPSSI